MDLGPELVGVEIAGEQVVVTRGGRPTFATGLAEFLEALVARADTLALPDAIPTGVRFIRRRGEAVVLVMEEAPAVRTVRWLADDSPARKGPGARYVTVSLAFPFVVVIVGFRGGALSGFQQCFYRVAPLRRLDDPLALPNLYNVADSSAGVRCWLCLAGLQSSLASLPWDAKVGAIRRHLWAGAFNQSADYPAPERYRPSYWPLMRGLDPRVSSLEAWTAESRRDPFFPLTVPWRPADLTVGEGITEVLRVSAPPPPPTSTGRLLAALTLCSTRPVPGRWTVASSRRVTAP